MGAFSVMDDFAKCDTNVCVDWDATERVGMVL